MEAITIRKAVKEDCLRLLELIQELAVYERSATAVTVTLDHFTTAGFGPRPVWWAFVAEVNNIIQGFALYYIRYSTWKGQTMYLEDIIVTATMRGKKIGTLLFDALIAEAKEKKIKRIDWQVLDWNKPAIEFYKKYTAMLDGAWINCHINL
jgi:N-acetylglutamate synthase-like GNAT family acetyltransferase